jgi:hypothetical protein
VFAMSEVPDSRRPSLPAGSGLDSQYFIQIPFSD